MSRPGFHLALLAGLLAGTLATSAAAQVAVFGTGADQEYGRLLWQAMIEARLAGAGAIHARPYPGVDPHGRFLETLNARIEVQGVAGTVIIKRNYGPAEGGAAEIWDDPSAYLAAITVMFRRSGFDPDNNDWFWARYDPAGGIVRNSDGVAMVGKVHQCLGCHANAPGGDYIYANE